MLRDALAPTLILAAAAAAALLLPRAFPARRERKVVEIMDANHVGVMIDGERVEVTTARSLPLSIGDRVRLARRARLLGVTLIPVPDRSGGATHHGGPPGS